MSSRVIDSVTLQIKGTTKDIAGKVTGDRILQGEGKIEKTLVSCTIDLIDSEAPQY